jgi:drug/metabolite transporter (DMT)-like permease
MQTAPDITPRSWIMVAVLGLIWGSTFLVIKVALEGITPFWLAAGRISFAALLTTAVWGLRGWRFHLGPERDWSGLIIVALLSTAVPFQLISWGQQYVTSAFAGVSMASVSLFVLPLAHVLLPGEQVTPRRLLGFVIGFIGVVVLLGQQSLTSTGAILEWPGRIACEMAASCYAISSVFMRRLPPIDAIGLAAVPLIIGSFFVVAVAFAIEGPPPLPSGETLMILAFLGIIPTAGANLLRVLVVRSAGPVFMTLTNYQVPMWSVILGILVLGEPFHASLLVALGFILCGVCLSQYGALKRLFGRK